MSTEISANPATDATTGKIVEGADPVKKRKGRVARPVHPSLLGENAAKLEEIPKDYSSKNHAPLKEENFADNKVDVFYDFEAAKFERRAVKLRDQAESFRNLGSFADRKTAKKVSDTLANVKEMIASLAAQGEDVSNLEDMLTGLITPKAKETDESKAA